MSTLTFITWLASPSLTFRNLVPKHHSLAPSSRHHHHHHTPKLRRHFTMAQHESRVARAALATPFIGLAVICLATMDTNKLIAQQQPFLNTGSVDFNGKSMLIFDKFYGVSIFDEMWRGITVTFANSYLPLDTIGWWQLFSFLHDLGPMYSVWLLESCRGGNVRTPAYT